MCLWVITACLGLLPGNPSSPVMVPALPSPIAVPSTAIPLITPQLVILQTAPPTPLPTTTTLAPAPTIIAIQSTTPDSALSGIITPLVICSNPEIVCVFNPHDLNGKMGPYKTRVSSPPINSPPITGYSAQVPSFNTAVKFPRSRRIAGRLTRIKYSWNNIKETDRGHQIKKRQLCGCVPIGTCASSNDNVIIGSLEVECLAGQDYCCGDSVDITTKISCGVIQTVRSLPRPTGPGQASSGGALLTQKDYVSGTVLIDELNVLTVAHKVLPYVTPGTTVNLKVRMGEWNATQLDPLFYQEYAVIKAFIHPKFFAHTLQNDIAVLRLASAVSITPSAGALATVNRACLPPTTSTVYTGQRCVVAGWGHQVFGPNGSIQAAIKMVDVPIVDPVRCQSLLRATRLGPSFTLDTASFICAGGEPDKDACTGDGGSGLVCQVDGKWILVGLVSWGVGCGSPNVPGVYINVASFLPWIQQQIQAS